MLRIFLTLSLLFPLVTLVGQQPVLAVNAVQEPPAKFLTELSLQAGINIIFSDDVVGLLPPVTMKLAGVKVEAVLNRMLAGGDVRYRFIDGQIVLYLAPVIREFEFSGMVLDSVTGEPLIAAYVADRRSGKGTATNQFGYFHLILPEGQAELVWGYLGYSSRSRVMEVAADRILTLRLQSGSLLPEVIVNADPDQQAGRVHVPLAEKITANALQQAVQLGGAIDLYRAADIIPGIQTGTDGIGGIQVRGGANDQNLILMDGVAVYHPNHLLGIVSVFNYQVLQQASIFKANFPSRYAGRLSSVIDVRTRDGNSKQWALAGAVGVAEGSLTLEGPLLQDKIGVLLSGRIFLPGLVMPDITRLIKKRNGVGGYADFDFSDINGKLTWRLGARDKIFASYYNGLDRIDDKTVLVRDITDPDTGFRILANEDYQKRLYWANRNGVLRWNHILSDKTFVNAILSSSRFLLQSVDRTVFAYSFPETVFDTLSGFDAKEFKSGIDDITGRIEFEIHPAEDHLLSAGGYASRYQFRPKSVTINEESKVGAFYLQEGLVDDIFFSAFTIAAQEFGVFAEDQWQIDARWRLVAGTHISSFFVQGIRYTNPQPRLVVEYAPSHRLALQGGYSRMNQYLHLLTSSSIGLPTDLWVPTTRRVAPAVADQYALSARWLMRANLTLDMGAYYKSMRQLVTYQEGASFLLREGLLPSSIVDAANWEDKITVGQGTAAGLEMEAAWHDKRFDILVNGTLASSRRQFDEINNGKSFPDRHDRRWSAGLQGTFRLSNKWTFDCQWLYGTGLAITLAESKFYTPGSFFPQIGINYSERNGFRLPPYHRFDVTLHYRLKEHPGFHHSLTLNLYNVYNRMNPFYVTLVEDQITRAFAYRQFSLFRFFPSLSYRFAFQ